MLEKACPDLEVVAVPDAEHVPLPGAGPPVTVLLSSAALSGAVHRLGPLLRHPGSRLVLLVQSLGREQLRIAAGLPVDAVLRESDLSEGALAATLAAGGEGVVALSRDTMRELLALAAEPGLHGPPAAPRLSPRELDTLRLMSDGLSNREIARSMRITEHGVKRHVANILVKLGCHNRTMAVALGMRTGLIDPAEATGALATAVPADARGAATGPAS